MASTEMGSANKSVVSIADLPTELLSYIFIQGLPPAAEVSSQPTHRYQANIVSTCSFWRDIALRTPALWCRIFVGLTKSDLQFDSTDPGHLTFEERLARAGIHPLHLYVDIAPTASQWFSWQSDQRMSSVVQSILPRVSQLTVVQFPDYFFPSSSHIFRIDSIPLLHTLTLIKTDLNIRGINTSTAPPPIPNDSLQHLFPPSLKSFIACSPQDSLPTIISRLYEQCVELDHLCIEKGYHSFFDVPLPPNIRTFEFSTNYGGPFAISPFSLNPHVVHVSIKCFNVSFRQQHSDLTLPDLSALRTLSLEVSEQSALEVARVLERAENLRALHISWDVLCSAFSLMHTRLGRTARGPAFRPKLGALRLLRIAFTMHLPYTLDENTITTVLLAPLSRILPFVPDAHIEWCIPLHQTASGELLSRYPCGRSLIRYNPPESPKLSHMLWTEADNASFA
ncbi:hypothetical protein DL93DRAFT_2193689 [Clavulina sp. PMI_390]|nr:hypothetical protein DL93DRAFT_2193689 [Clavulina sp. PMI_390]